MGEWKDKIEGKTREIKGKVTGDQVEELKGKAQETWGDAQGKFDDLKDSWKQRNAERSETGDAGRPLPGEGIQPEET